MTRRNDGNDPGVSPPSLATRRSSAGEPNMSVTPNSRIGPAMWPGLTRAGRVASMSGTIAVIPSVGANRANSGKVQRSTSPGSMP
jgi:hypothetical protein